MRFGPPVRFTRRPDGRHLAYQVVGEGELDLVYLFGWASHLGLVWDHPAYAEFLARLSAFFRLVLLRRRGEAGAGGPAPPGWCGTIPRTQSSWPGCRRSRG